MDCSRGGVVNWWYCMGRWGGGRGGVVEMWCCVGRLSEGGGVGCGLSV